MRVRLPQPNPMAKLSSLKPRIATLPQRFGYAPGNERARDSFRSKTQPWRAWYKTAEWRRLREIVLHRDVYTCRLCQRICSHKGEAVVDHIIPHRGDRAKFVQLSNLQVLCAPCHNGRKQSEEKRFAAY